MPLTHEMAQRMAEVQAEIHRRWSILQAIMSDGTTILERLYAWSAEYQLTDHYHAWVTRHPTQEVSFHGYKVTLNVSNGLVDFQLNPAPELTSRAAWEDPSLDAKYANLPNLANDAHNEFLDEVLATLRNDFMSFIESSAP